MFDVQALIYTGNRQQLIHQSCESEDAFFARLQATHGVYVCLWYDMQPAAGGIQSVKSDKQAQHAVN
ncbi:hypothetical protein OCL06_11800 [Alteromonas sp. ASW11-19]|uniref:Uncharacterized protein n=1 Tax=Alteromonas salexigens TaxID=2982530 RepID=A0ABT2VQV9_9ALTE|nr:hypothetical protein [Alteromonas salexigens]MCU7555272.1 hypothetical protein [Alteromonas salexigens]